jgi:hypothetical protein
MEVQSRYVAALQAEANAREALTMANSTDDIEAQAHAFANVVCAEEKSRNAFDARSQRQFLGASTLAAEERERVRRCDSYSAQSRTVIRGL